MLERPQQTGTTARPVRLAKVFQEIHLAHTEETDSGEIATLRSSLRPVLWRKLLHSGPLVLTAQGNKSLDNREGFLLANLQPINYDG